ncbi:MAG TPA: DUF433 domain-containing protein [Lacipirellulaceae bacterium]|jgi:uncharacterized protein (DUF433 family)|nr:DUF433 domain-containing protein [Lacipirellulaceae bacterium]
MEAIQHIETNPNKCGGKPCIAGTRIRVWDVHVWHHLRGQSPEQIITDFPQLTLADVHAALAHYFDHRDEIQQQMKEAEEFVDEMRRTQSPTKFDMLKKALGLDDTLPSG